MSLSISSINSEIAECQKKIDERRIFVSKLGSLKSNTQKTVDNLSDASDKLKMGLLLDNQSADNGKLEEYYNSLKKSILKIDEASGLAESEIRQYEDLLSSLKSKKMRLEAEEAENSRRQTLEYRGTGQSNDRSTYKLPARMGTERKIEKLPGTMNNRGTLEKL